MLTDKRSYFISLILILLTNSCPNIPVSAQNNQTQLHYKVSFSDPSIHYYHIELNCSGWMEDTIVFKMPKWMPGYYQIMDYGREVDNVAVKGKNDVNIPVIRINDNTWQIVIPNNAVFSLSYDVKANKRFVANSFLDSTHGYIVNAATFMYIEGHINTPVSVEVFTGEWKQIATGLDSVQGNKNKFLAPDFDIFYDCPILIGNLEELPPFFVNGIKHRFIGYEMGDFIRDEFMTNLKKVVQGAIDLMGDVPYKEYTFIGIGPGQGGIEHLNNTTVSFNGNGLHNKQSMNREMNFLAHEYFHNFNVKRIRPYELGPFDYDKENRSNLLWFSEGLSVYYEYLIVNRAGLIDEQELFSNIEKNIGSTENDPGRFYQSLIQASYNTWSDGPFGNRNVDGDKSISYYEKGPLAGLILDFAIRNATGNRKSLDDVMRFLYWEYYKKQNRGFTDAEVQQACEMVAGISLSAEFEYINTTKEIDYQKYLSYAGLQMSTSINQENRSKTYSISRMANADSTQNAIFKSWLGE
jgi:predicted metalloprotease with PDZ domain